MPKVPVPQSALTCWLTLDGINMQETKLDPSMTAEAFR